MIALMKPSLIYDEPNKTPLNTQIKTMQDSTRQVTRKCEYIFLYINIVYFNAKTIYFNRASLLKVLILRYIFISIIFKITLIHL